MKFSKSEHYTAIHGAKLSAPCCGYFIPRERHRKVARALQLNMKISKSEYHTAIYGAKLLIPYCAYFTPRERHRKVGRVLGLVSMLQNGDKFPFQIGISP
jgi:hypothetical protein